MQKVSMTCKLLQTPFNESNNVKYVGAITPDKQNQSQISSIIRYRTIAVARTKEVVSSYAVYGSIRILLLLELDISLE